MPRGGQAVPRGVQWALGGMSAAATAVVVRAVRAEAVAVVGGTYTSGVALAPRPNAAECTAGEMDVRQFTSLLVRYIRIILIKQNQTASVCGHMCGNKVLTHHYTSSHVIARLHTSLLQRFIFSYSL